MNFKDMVEQDLQNVFYNTEEFAREVTLGYCGAWYRVPAQVCQVRAGDRDRLRDDHAAGLLDVALVLRVRLVDLTLTPRQGRVLTVGDEDYRIRSVETSEGELILGLGRLDE